jgi:heptose I phosphotransferase
MTTIWIADHNRAELAAAGLATFDQVMSTTAGRCLRVLPDRENWYLQGSRYAPRAVRPKLHDSEIEMVSEPRLADGTRSVPATFGFYLKKHRGQSLRTRLAAALGLAPPPSPGRIEAENALTLQSLGIDVMPLTAYGEQLHADGRMESFLLSEELTGYCELQDFIARRFPANVSGTLRVPLPGGTRSVPDTFLRRLIVQVANIARRFHAAGFNHRDFYCCHFLVKETSPGACDVRLIDLQRVQRRRWFRRRWIVKDLAQLASMSPDGQIGCREKVLFLRAYLGVNKLRRQDKQFVRAVLRKLASIRRRTRIQARRASEGGTRIKARSASEGGTRA